MQFIWLCFFYQNESYYHTSYSCFFDYFSWEPNHVAAGSSKGSSRRKFDILGIMVSIIGSKDQLINEYRVMLAEKLLNKSDYDIDSEIRTVELLKVDRDSMIYVKCFSHLP